MSDFTGALILVAVLLPVVLYVCLAFRERRNVHGLRDFFPLTHFLPADKYGRSTAASGISLATVVLALINLTPFIGLGLFVTIASYAASFVILYFCAPVILRANTENNTIQAFLGKAYGTTRVRDAALIFTFIGYTSIFAMELMVGVTVLEPFFGDKVLIVSAIYLVLLLLYSMISGFRAVVATEQWQIRFILVAVLSLFVTVAIVWNASPSNLTASDIAGKVLDTAGISLTFAAGIIALNLPATISDAGTWQRLCATRSETDARRGLIRAIWLFVVLWGTLIIAGTAIAQIAMSGGQFDATRETLMAYIVTSLAKGGVIPLLILFVFMLGLFAAMITTADSLLLVAAQMYAIDFADLPSKAIAESRKINVARWALAGIAMSAFIIFLIFKLIDFDVVQLVFAIYGAQLALFPSVAVALFLKSRINLSQVKTAAIFSVVSGFVGAWISAFYGKFSGDMNWTFNAPVVALAVSSIVLTLFSGRAWKKS